MTVNHRPIPARDVRPRRIGFEYPPRAFPKHYVNDDLIMSHVVSVLSSLFPEGEDFFVRSVRHYRDEIEDVELRRQVAGFIGQEATHGREHRAFNERLHSLGYPTRELDRLVKVGRVVGEKVLPKGVQLAITAALEHYTATIAETLLSDPEAQAMLVNDEIRSMWLWHALEEAEHKSVAFDVYQTVSGNHLIRVAVMHAATVGFLGGLALATARSMLADPSTRDLRRLRQSVAALRRSPFFTRKIARQLRAYNGRGFHPDDRDASALTEQWRTQLFGADGALAGRLAG